MSKYSNYHVQILQHILQTKCSSWHNLFHRDSELIRNIAGENRDINILQQISATTQQAFQKLLSEGLVYDTNGDRWYSLTEAGKKLLKSNMELLPTIDFETVKNDYELHPGIKSVALDLFKNGHYKEAIQAALVEVINRVKVVAKNPHGSNARELDGDDLMNRVFGCDGVNTPLVKLNNLSDTLDRAEQRGFMYLFKGVVGIRDKKAHLNFVQNDSFKTLEYLALASLLMRLLDDEFLKHYNTHLYQSENISVKDNK